VISVSSIKEYMYCPLKLYLKHNLDEKVENHILLNKTIKQARIDLNDLIQRNIRGLNKEMSLGEIRDYLKINIDENASRSLEILSDKNVASEEEIYEIEKELISDIYFIIDTISLKALKAMRSLEKDGSEIVEMFFPTSMYSYLIRDLNLEILGTCDKIEIIDGRYYPIDIKTSNPPLQGVWDSDAIKLVANAMLIEQEFDTEVFVGFVDYTKIGEKRPVIMDSKLRKSLFKVLHEIKELLEEGIVPEISSDMKKCKKCPYLDICHGNEENLVEESNT